ncbi:MAG: hypothetical protein ACE5FU_12775 [Nitrospinota bacterium]
MKTFKIILPALLVFLFFFTPLVFSETIHVYTYHAHPPFSNKGNEGFSRDLVNLMNKKADNTFTFSLEIIPRSRLNLILRKWIDGKCLDHESRCKKNWMVLWVNPVWGFGSEPQKKYMWVKMLDDSNAIISLNEKKVEYENPKSLEGLKFGGMRGHRYLGIDELAAQKKLIRIDGNKEKENILKLVMKRVDTILLPNSTIQYYLKKDDEISKYKDKIYVAPSKHQVFSRNFMIPLREDLKKFVESSILKSNEWNALISEYGF